MTNYNSTTLFASPRHIESLDECVFYHTMDVPGFGVVRGHWDLRGRFEDYVGGVDVSGKSVLDVGTATGFLSFEAEEKGASRVTSFDMSDVRQQTLLPFKDNLYYRDRDRWADEVHGPYMDRWKNAYWLCHRLLGSRAEVAYGSVYDMPIQLGEYDVVIVGSVVEHLSDQITALGSISRLTKETLVLITPLVESDEPVAHFAARAATPEHDFTWWIYSVGVYREVLGMLGFRIERITRGEYFHDYAQRFEERFTIVAVRESS
jgi:SAM-dependent methyltransferase